MHLPDGILPLNQSLIYWILTVIILIISFYKFTKNNDKDKRTVAMAIFAVFMTVVSSISIPSPLGVPMHFFTVPLIVFLIGHNDANIVCFISLFSQALLLGMGGIVSFGANFLVIGFIITTTTSIVYKFFSKINSYYAIFISTVLGIMFATFGQIIILVLSGTMTLYALLTVLVPFYLIISIIEGILTVFIINFIKSVKPEILENSIIKF